MTAITLNNARELPNQINGKAFFVQAWTDPQGCRRLRLLEFLDNPHMKVVKLSTLSTGRLYLPREDTDYSFLLKAEFTPGP